MLSTLMECWKGELDPINVSFTINGEKFEISPTSVPIDTSLNTFIRDHVHLKGTKFMCLEGGCGACIVTLIGLHPATKIKKTWAVNSCLQNVYSCNGLEILTVEGIGSKKNGMHGIQSRLANFNGTQCGYCSPGMVMNMYSLLESKNGKVTKEEVENSFGGNICRCTGYRPILDAFKSLASDADQDLLDACKDIEDLGSIKSCPKTGKSCAGKCPAKKPPRNPLIHLQFDENNEWIKVYTIKDIFANFAKLEGKKYMLVAGNTAHGVYRRSPNLQVFIDISEVPKLREFKLDTNLELGGNVTLTDAMEIFTKIFNQQPGFEYLKELVKHIDLVANVPVRNNGTIGGNLMIKHAHHEFPSDMFLMLEAAGAKITIAESTKVTYAMFLKDFLAIDMDQKLIWKITLQPLDPSKFIFRSFKIMPRAQNAHAYVNAAFLVEMDSAKDKVVSAQLCFGGINPFTIHAEKTEQFLIGKSFFSNETFQGAINVLNSELFPDWVLPDVSPDYRKNLALGLFYKFILQVAPDSKTNPKFKSGGKVLTRAVSSGKQEFDTYEKNYPLTKNIPKIEADVQCTGEAAYMNDLPNLPKELYAAFVLADKANTKLKSINPAPALKIPGVVAFYSAKDIPGKNNFTPAEIGSSDIEEVFCSSQVKFHGQPIGVILAETMQLANYAAKFVQVMYDNTVEAPQILPTIQDVQKVKNQAFRSTKGPSKKAQKFGLGATHKIDGHFEINGQYHFTMEAQTCVVVPIEDGLDVYSSTQWIDSSQIAIANTLNVPNNYINMNVRRLGGAYGSKISRSAQIACAAALAAYLLNRPVRFVLTIEQNMTVCGKRFACINDYEVEFDDEGKIQKLKNDYAEDFGCSNNESPLEGTTEHFKNCYDARPFTVKSMATLTDAPSSTWCRAPGTTEGIAMIENIMEHIAFKIKKDPVDVRMANIPSINNMKKILPEFLESVDYRNRKNEINTFNDANRWTKKGIAVVPMRYLLDYFGSMNALVSIFHGDGSVAITHGGIEMGQGINTKIAQVAASTLGIPLEKISIKPTNTMTAPNAIVTGGSIGSEISCFAVKQACEILNKRLKPLKVANPNDDWGTIAMKAYVAGIDLMASSFYKAADLKGYIIWGVTCCEVEIDLLSGNVQLKRVDILEDLGESMSPGIDVGQIEGSFVMGVGYWLTESLVYNKENGELLTNRTWTYKPPGAKDIPVDFRIKFLQKSSNKFGVLRSKASGEPATCMSIVVIFAIRHALDSARKDSGIADDKFYHLGAPTTPENIFLAANNLKEQFLLS